ncbi:aspartate/glutamate racemase family protein [Bradyrhizobium huanghuaihaiense]|uniref:aspartate/glutamate racemase family protein n=1 Tax=Bradyrhizobium huanghuaihaiense TaxID=990078 RepID=UPI0021A9A752|nr:aspartate/glutamate racemase family protein [Bradyrhizobium sp. CB3035]UWU75872.1 aspartate/glutamate racemase family protein [Bradyrhizobium sp. CB3035]
MISQAAFVATMNVQRRMMESGLLRGGQNVYGHRVGILMIETLIPRPPGAIGNASSFAFPVLHYVVKGTSGNGTVRDLGALDPESMEFRQAIEPWLNGARYLEQQGCHAITTSCGFSVLFQHQLLEAVGIPVFSSSLMLIPFIAATLRRERRVGVITADARSLSARHLSAAHIDPARIHVAGMDGCPEFAKTAWQNDTTLDFPRIKNEVVTVAKRLVDEAPDTGALLLECALLPPYAGAIQAEVGLPVFDFTHLVTLIHNACARTSFAGLV